MERDKTLIVRAQSGPIYQEALTVRQYYAAKAMHAIIVRSEVRVMDDKSIATQSFNLADAMLRHEKGEK